MFKKLLKECKKFTVHKQPIPDVLNGIIYIYQYYLLFYFTLHNYYLIPATAIFNNTKNEALQNLLGPQLPKEKAQKPDEISRAELIDQVK